MFLFENIKYLYSYRFQVQETPTRHTFKSAFCQINNLIKWFVGKRIVNVHLFREVSHHQVLFKLKFNLLNYNNAFKRFCMSPCPLHVGFPHGLLTWHPQAGLVPLTGVTVVVSEPPEPVPDVTVVVSEPVSGVSVVVSELSEPHSHVGEPIGASQFFPGLPSKPFCVVALPPSPPTPPPPPCLPEYPPFPPSPPAPPIPN